MAKGDKRGDEAHAPARRITAIPARTVAGIAVNLRVALDWNGGDLDATVLNAVLPDPTGRLPLAGGWSEHRTSRWIRWSAGSSP